MKLHRVGIIATIIAVSGFAFVLIIMPYLTNVGIIPGPRSWEGHVMGLAIGTPSAIFGIFSVFYWLAFFSESKRRKGNES